MDIRDIKTIEDVAAFCKRKGFIFQGSEIYGGLAGFWDYGPMGTQLKNKLKQHWIKHFINKRDDMVLIDGAVITKEDVWKASGHVASFVDTAVVCKKCKNKTKVDKHEFGKIKCDKCGGEYENKGEFNPMFSTQVGPIKDDSVKAYLRPETCQTIFTNFKNVLDSTRIKLPFGIAQIGKAFRNEIAPRDFIFRCREFEQMEIEYFVHPDEINKCIYKLPNKTLNVLTAKEQGKKIPKVEKIKLTDFVKKRLVKTEWHAYWIWQHYNWFLELGIHENKMRLREHMKSELSHYSSATFDIEYEFPFGWKELGGNADRSQFDLTQHMKFSKQDLTYFDGVKRVTPAVAAEPSQGIDRAILAVILDAFTIDGDRILLKLKKDLAPIEVAVFPLIKKDHEKLSREVYNLLKEHFITFYDSASSIGRRYRRMDEVGCPISITIDDISIKDKTVTLRNRDSMKQIRVKIKDLVEVLQKLFSSTIKFEKAGKIIKTVAKDE